MKKDEMERVGDLLKNMVKEIKNNRAIVQETVDVLKKINEKLKHYDGYSAQRTAIGFCSTLVKHIARDSYNMCFVSLTYVMYHLDSESVENSQECVLKCIDTLNSYLSALDNTITIYSDIWEQ